MRLWPDLLFANGREVSGHVVSIADGRITAVQPPTPADSSAASDVLRLPGKALLPGTVNCTNNRQSVFQKVRHLGVTAVWVHGRSVVRGQHLATLDQAGLMERVRALTHDWKPA